ncbi:MAG: fibronectin type III domain-containing protein [Kandleria vitulina]|uniref:fibronectin type III domain-containing protein n=1 Tax=Kandleria vitulina TaxID=1630 RepID=UPI002E769B5E|nr:fibronectin type III domain-containing protein [Kandleria vitulina]MEE0989655.1 fibronectin type III domain-containing protein [Kandleria vitulina]
MKKKFLSLFGVLLLCSTMIMGKVSVHAYNINGADMFWTQQEKNTCTLASAVMLLRRKAALLNDADYKSITESSLKSKAWNGGLKWDFEFSTKNYTYTVQHAAIDSYNNAPDVKGEAKKNVVLSWLKSHPEGVCLYARKDYNGFHDSNHCVLLTDYTGGLFYAADSAKNASRVTIDKVRKVTIENAASIWYVSKVKKSNDTVLSDANMSLSTVYYTYNGQVRKPKVTFKMNNKKVSSAHYSLSYPNAKNVGKYCITAKRKGEYCGNKHAYFYILPKAVTISSLKKKKKGFTVSYKKVQGNVKYQIAYRIKNGSWKYAYSSTVKNLKSKKTYQVKVRAYNNGAYGSYGKVKSVKTK